MTTRSSSSTGSRSRRSSSSDRRQYSRADVLNFDSEGEDDNAGENCTASGPRSARSCALGAAPGCDRGRRRDLGRGRDRRAAGARRRGYPPDRGPSRRPGGVRRQPSTGPRRGPADRRDAERSAGARRGGRAGGTAIARGEENIGLIAGGRLLAGEDSWSASRTVPVTTENGEPVGEVVVGVPLNDSLAETSRRPGFPTPTPSRSPTRARRSRPSARSSPVRCLRASRERSSVGDEAYRFVSSPLLEDTGVSLAALDVRGADRGRRRATHGAVRSSLHSPPSGSGSSSPGWSRSSKAAVPPRRRSRRRRTSTAARPMSAAAATSSASRRQWPSSARRWRLPTTRRRSCP